MKDIERKLETGLSGCKLELIGSNILRKHSSSESYNKRLELQVKKQELFSTQVFRNVETPKVLSKGDSYFDMEYVTGRSFDEYFSICSVNDIEFVFDSLCGYFDGLISHSQYYQPEVSKKRLLDKINSLLNDSESDNYELIRKKKISNYIKGRQKLRDLNWYLNRLNLNSIGILYKAKINSSRYKDEFATKIDLHEKYL